MQDAGTFMSLVIVTVFVFCLLALFVALYIPFLFPHVNRTPLGG
jgi:hypothetical protein